MARFVQNKPKRPNTPLERVACEDQRYGPGVKENPGPLRLIHTRNQNLL